MERVEKIELNIPSVYAHGVFRKDGKDILLSKKGIEYYYILIWIARGKLVGAFEQTKDEDGKILYKVGGNDWNVKLDIYMYDILRIVNPNHKSDFKALRQFLNVLNDLCIETNVLAKTAEAPITIKIIESLVIDDIQSSIMIKFNIDFIKEFIHTKQFFKKVYLNYLFYLNGYKDKILYLVLKDYVGIAKDINNKQMSRLIGEKSDKKIATLIKNINYNTDIEIIEPKVQPKDLGKHRLIYSYKVKAKLVFLDIYDRIEYNIKQDLRFKAKAETPSVNKNGDIIKNTEAYTNKIYKTLMKDFKNINQIEIKLAEAREKLEVYRDDSYKQYILMVDEDGMKYLLQDTYQLFGYSNVTQKTTTIKETSKILETIISFDILNLNSISATHGSKSLL